MVTKYDSTLVLVLSVFKIFRRILFMKKKIIALMLTSLFLVSCGKKEEPKKEETKTTESTKTEEKKEEKKKDNISFDGKVAELNDLKIEIIEYKIIKVGEKGNEYGSKPVIAFWYNTTNKSDKEIDPSIAWLAVFTAIQDNNKNMVNELKVAGHPDDSLIDTQDAKIKKGGTVKNAIAYELSDETTPVTLKATQGMDGKDLGQKNFEVK
jgi:hypothetical protein